MYQINPSVDNVIACIGKTHTHAHAPPHTHTHTHTYIHIYIYINRRERDHWGDLGVDGWIILGWISRRWDVGMWTGLGWPRIWTGGGRL